MPGQLDHYYFFHAHHQLNGKELRYLRTLKVRAAVYRGIVRNLPLRYWAEFTPYTTPYGLAECCVFGKQLQSFSLGNLVPLLIPKLRSYLPSSLAYLNSPALVDCHPRACVGFITVFAGDYTFPDKSPDPHRLHSSAQALGTAYIGPHNGAQ